MDAVRIARSGLTYLVMLAGSLVLWPLAIVAAAFGRRDLGDLLVPVTWSRATLLAIGVRREAHGLEHAAGVGGPCVILSNHRSHLDGPILLCTLPLRFAFIIKRSLARVPFWGWAVSALGYVSIDRHDRADSVSGMKRAAAAVRRGRSVLVFPEGTRSKSGDPLPFKKGGFVLAIEAQVPILPVALAGTAEILRSGEFTAKAGRAVVCVGRPIPTEGLTYDEREALLVKVEAEIRRLYDEAAGLLRSRT